MDLPFRWPTALFTVLQAALVLLPAAGLPAWAGRWAGRAWSLVLPGSIALVVGLLAVVPELARALTWLALLAIPPLAALALAWAIPVRPRRDVVAAAAALAVALLVVAVAAEGRLGGQAAAAALTALSVVTLARLLVGAVGAVGRSATAWIRIGLVGMAAIDAVLVLSSALDQPNATLNAAAPAAGLPRLQYVALDRASMGYGDVFVAAVLGAVLAHEGASRALRRRAALLVLGLGVGFDLLFWVLDTLPATVPIAVATLLVGGLRGPAGGRWDDVRPRRARRPRPPSAPPTAPRGPAR